MTGIPYTTYTKAQWQSLLQQAVHKHDVPAVRAIVSALNEYDKQEVPPTTGELLGAEAKGVSQLPGDVMKGLGQTLSDVAGMHLGKAAQDVIQGMGAGVKGTLELPATALRMAGQKLTGEPVTSPDRSDLLQQAHAYGEAAPLTAVLARSLVKSTPNIIRGLTAIPRGIVRGTLGTALRTLGQSIKSGAPGEAASPAAADVSAVEGFQPTSSGNLPPTGSTPFEPSPRDLPINVMRPTGYDPYVGAPTGPSPLARINVEPNPQTGAMTVPGASSPTPIVVEPNPVTAPFGVPKPAGFDPYATGTPTSTLEQTLEQLGKGVQGQLVPGYESTEATGAAAQSGGSGAAGVTPPTSGVSTMQPVPGVPRGFTAVGPPNPAIPANAPTIGEMTGVYGWQRPVEPPTPSDITSTQPYSGVSGQKGVTFGKESPFSPAVKGDIKALLGEIMRSLH